MLDLPADLLVILDRYELLDDFIRRRLVEQMINTQPLPLSYPGLPHPAPSVINHERLQSDDPKRAGADSLDQQTRTHKLLQYKKKSFSSLAKIHYLKNRHLYDMLFYGVISTQERPMALELYFRVVDDHHRFWDLATEYSQDISRFSGGVIGPIRVCNVAPAIADQLLALKPQSVCQPFLFNERWHILYLARYIRSSLSGELHAQIIDTLFNEHLDQQLERYKREVMPHLQGIQL